MNVYIVNTFIFVYKMYKININFIKWTKMTIHIIKKFDIYYMDTLYNVVLHFINRAISLINGCDICMIQTKWEVVDIIYHMYILYIRIYIICICLLYIYIFFLNCPNSNGQCK